MKGNKCWRKSLSEVFIFVNFFFNNLQLSPDRILSTLILTHWLLIRADNEAVFEGALLMLLLLSSPENGQNPVIAACRRQWQLDHISFETKESYEGLQSLH